jgi:PAS domain S-box-containing protein
VAVELLSIFPNEIKFLYRYGTFLYQIVNNEYDGMSRLEQAYMIYQTKISKKAATMPINEQTIFGENSAAAIVIVSATSLEIGRIEHVNDEIEHLLGYKRRDILGKNCGVLMPRPIGDAHNSFIERYFETAKARVIDKRVQHLAACADGYLKPVKMLVKVYPQLNDRLMFIAFVQASDKYEEMDPPKSQYEHMDY